MVLYNGENNGGAKITVTIVKDIRLKYKAGRGQRQLGREYDLHNTTIHHIVHNIAWKHVKG